MVGLYVAFTDRVAYYPVHGTVTLYGRPVVGATVYLDADHDAFDAALSVGPDGKFAYGTENLAGGAPAGTKYRVRIESSGRDYLVRLDEPGPRARSEPTVTVLAWMPAGTQVLDWVEKQEGEEQRVYLLETSRPARGLWSRRTPGSRSAAAPRPRRDTPRSTPRGLGSRSRRRSTRRS